MHCCTTGRGRTSSSSQQCQQLIADAPRATEAARREDLDKGGSLAQTAPARQRSKEIMETPPEAVEMAVEPTGPPAPAPAPELVRTSFVIPDLAAFANGLQSLSRPQRVKRL